MRKKIKKGKAFMGKVVVKNVLLRNQRDEILLTEGFGSKVRELRLEMIA
ncbi:MAG: hypothetical protein HQM12_00280 [SAR324 cluster bacterium]|nr:hypothetical protein [SAR324 cluster bacterium]